MKNLLAIILILAISACASVKSNKINKKKYPSWLIQPQNTITGLSAKYYYEDKSIDVALQNAINKYGKLQYCLVKGGQTFIQTPAGMSIVDDSLYVHIFENDKFTDKFFYEYTPVDTFTSTGFVAVCFADKNSSNGQKSDLVYLDDECEWAKEPPLDDEFIYAIGYCDILGDELRSWQYAENHAILSLAKQKSMDKFGEELEADGTRMSMSIENINIELHDIEIVERWKDEKYNIYYVLIRMKK
ncbi:MAG: hypothetical protein U9P79_05755 [Candidatus Cloacimonadota bacterium]|nr:hypothetical protein [Candidatus Cloacimonadota bacterium]